MIPVCPRVPQIGCDVNQTDIKVMIIFSGNKSDIYVHSGNSLTLHTIGIGTRWT
jgi:hypothetical protein